MRRLSVGPELSGQTLSRGRCLNDVCRTTTLAAVDVGGDSDPSRNGTTGLIRLCADGGPNSPSRRSKTKSCSLQRSGN